MQKRTPRLCRLDVALGAVGVFALVIAAFPHLGFSRALSSYFPFAQLLAFPFALGSLLLLLTVAAAIICWWKRCHWLSWLNCALWLVAAACLLLLPYGIPAKVVADTEVPQRSLKVVTFNTGSTMRPQDFEELTARYNPDIIVLPETTVFDARRGLERANYAGRVFGTTGEGFSGSYQGRIAPTTVVTKEDLGAATPIAGPATAFGTVALQFDDPDLPIVLGIHAAPPLPGLMRQWREDVERVRSFGESSTTPMVIAGDFNATLRHGAVASRLRLMDTQELCGGRQAGTWPARAPGILRSPIDHVFITQPIGVESCHVVRIGESDHLAYVSTLRIR